MKYKMFASVVGLALGFVASTAAACPDDEKNLIKKDQAATKVADKAKAPCSKPCAFKGATTVADKAKAGNTPCPFKSATTVADKGKTNGKPCCGGTGCGCACCGTKAKNVTLTKGKGCCGGAGCGCACCGTKVKNVAGVNAKTAITVADKAKVGSTPCPFKSATTVADKGKTNGKPCSFKGAKTVTASSKPCGVNCSQDCCKKGAKLTAAKDEGCPVARKVNAVLASLPAMKYRVGEEVTSCFMGASASAEKTGKPIHFIVGDDTFTNKGEAIVKLTSLLEREVETLQALQFVAGGKCGRCPMTAKSIAKKTNSTVVYRVGGVDFNKKEDAQRVIQLVRDTVADVGMTYKADGKTFGCSKLARELKNSDKALTYVVGDEETPCHTTAKLMETEAKIRKIVETAAAASFSL